MYSRNIAHRILIKLHERRWNPYSSNHILARGRDTIIRQGPAQRLEVRGSYVLFPQIAEPREPVEVIEALDHLVIKLGALPTITFDGKHHVFEGFTFHPESVKTYTPPGLVVGYEVFLAGLETLVRGV